MGLQYSNESFNFKNDRVVVISVVKKKITSNAKVAENAVRLPQFVVARRVAEGSVGFCSTL